MKLPLYQIDAFANQVFEGNSAAICPLKSWLADELMQKIAAENNLSETAFFVPTDTGYHIRWFTPVCEVDLCGHATLAAAFVIFNLLGDEIENKNKNKNKNKINFDSKSGVLVVTKKENFLEMDFPAQPATPCAIPEAILTAFNVRPMACLKSQDYIVVFDSEDDVIKAKPDMLKLSELDLRGVAITAKGKDYDFVTRFFAPKYGIDEDPVTGSAFTQLIPYWSEELARNKLSAKQISKRGGEVSCVDEVDRVKIAGKAVLYLVGEIEV